MNNVISKDVFLKLYDKNGDCKEIRLEQWKEYELTIRATYYDSDDLVLSFVNELSDIIVSVDDIINIEEAN